MMNRVVPPYKDRFARLLVFALLVIIIAIFAAALPANADPLSFGYF